MGTLLLYSAGGIPTIVGSSEILCDWRLKRRNHEDLMPLKIPANQIRNLQQMEVVVSGPDEANRLIIIDGQFDTEPIAADSVNRLNKLTFSVLLGPKLTHREFVRAIATASFARTETSGHTMCNIWDVDADWDDESGQVELRIEAEVGAFSSSGRARIYALAFHVTILAALAAP